MVEREISSSFLNETIIIKWYQPEAFTPLENYHLCLMQDGDDYFRMGRVATISDQLHEDGEIDTTVFVGIHYRNRYDRLDKYHPDGKKHIAYSQFIMEEVLPLLDQELLADQSTITKTIIGDSLAGTFALMMALNYPNTFDQVIMQSPYVDQTVINAVQQADNLEKLAIYHTIGTKETEVPTTFGEKQDFIKPNRQLNKLLKEFTTDYYYHEFDGIHTWKYWQRDLPKALITMFE